MHDVVAIEMLHCCTCVNVILVAIYFGWLKSMQYISPIHVNFSSGSVLLYKIVILPATAAPARMRNLARLSRPAPALGLNILRP